MSAGQTNMRSTYPTSFSRPLASGFSTLEVLLAMTILVLTITSVTLTSYGSQTMQTDAETGTEALHTAQDGLEYMQTLSRKDFQLVNPTTTDKTIGTATYHRVISVSTTTAPDYATKQITSTVTWQGENNRMQHVTLSALVTNFDHAAGGETCDSVPSGNWALPIVKNAANTDMLSLTGTSTGVNVITNIDAYKGKVYLTVKDAQYKTDPRLFVFDIAKLKTDPTHSLLGKLTTATNTTASGMYAVQVAEGPSGKRYAYIANDYQANWSSCSAYYNCAQLSIVDVTDPSKMVLASTTYFKLPNVSGALNSGGSGNALFYKDGLLYLGLTRTLSGPEFNIIDVHDPKSPLWLGAANVDFDVSAISVVGNTAYLATNNDTGEVLTMDVSNPSSPTLLATYDAPGQTVAGYGRSLDVVGDTVYLGRSQLNSGAEFLVLDASSTTGVIPPTPLGSRDIGTASLPFTVYGTLVRSSLGFLTGGNGIGSGGKFYVEQMSNLGSITDYASTTLPNSSTGFALDCEGSDIFVGSRDAANMGYLSVITSSP